jgi:leucine dehydrogenase
VLTDSGSIDAHRVVEISDEASGLEAVIAIHSVREELTAGGIRRVEYASVDEAREEAKRLARAMSLKTAIAELPSGGAKTVIRDSGGLDVELAYRALGRAIDQLEPAYLCGPDVGTGEDELEHVREVTDRVNPRPNAPGRATAVGVLSGIQAVMEAITGVPAAEGGSFLVQGYGSVGANVAHGLADQGGKVFVADTDEEAVERAEQKGLTTVEPDAWLEQDVDVFVPCATGGVIVEEAARSIEADGVCGSANNPIASWKAAEILHERGIFYAPDVLVNCGAIAEGVLTWREGDTPRVQDQIDRIISGVYERAREVIEEAYREDVSEMRVVLERWG